MKKTNPKRKTLLFLFLLIVLAISACKKKIKCETTDGELTANEMSYFYPPNQKIFFKLVGSNIYDTLTTGGVQITDGQNTMTIPDCNHGQKVGDQILGLFNTGNLYIIIPHQDEWHKDSYPLIVCTASADEFYLLNGVNQNSVVVYGTTYTNILKITSSKGSAGTISTIYYSNATGIIKYIKAGVGTFEKTN